MESSFLGVLKKHLDVALEDMVNLMVVGLDGFRGLIQPQ